MWKQKFTSSHLCFAVIGMLVGAYSRAMSQTHVKQDCDKPNVQTIQGAYCALDKFMGVDALAAQIDNPRTRDEWMRSFSLTIPAGSRILDVSAGNRPYQHLWRHCHYFSHEFPGNTHLTDMFRGELHGQKTYQDLKLKHDYIGDILNTTAPSDSFDVVTLTEVLEHIPEPVGAFKELARVARKGGHIIVTAPFTSGSHQLPFHFAGGYSREFYRYAANVSGLSVVTITSQGDYFKLMAQELQRVSTCGGFPWVPSADVNAVVSVLAKYFLQLSKRYGDGSAEPATCANQFTIGWIAHLRK